MAATTPIQIYVEPTLGSWAGQLRPGGERPALLQHLQQETRRLGLEPPSGSRFWIGTGHQPWLWHPGILAKDVAAGVLAARRKAQPVHVVVDQDTHDASVLEVPQVVGQRIVVHRVVLAGGSDEGVPAGMQPALDAGKVRDSLAAVAGPMVEPLIAAFDDLPECRSLAEQMTVVLGRLMTPWTGPMPVLFASRLHDLPVAQRWLARLVEDARGAVIAYNDAVAAHPGAGITPLTVTGDRVELPLWRLHWGRPRMRVYADMQRRPTLLDEQGWSFDVTEARLAPRALWLTALMRAALCDGFIHGKGGGIYDRITEQWWRRWTGQSLPPMAVVSADLRLPFAVPVAEPADLTRAIWWRHHLPHNVDRVAGTMADVRLVQRKHDLLRHMGDDRDPRRRRLAYDAVNGINRQLAASHAHLLSAAEQRLHEARLGVANRETARRRDWCFALYPAPMLAELKQAMTAELER